MSNPIIKHKFTADPTVLVHQQSVYLYTGHDDPPEGIDDYVMNDWCCFSSTDMVNWHEHPTPLRATDFTWASGDAYASKVIERNGKFYWYAAVTHAAITGKAIAVAVSDNPEGPFTDARGSALIDLDMLPGVNDEMTNLDPSVLIDDDGQAYIFWGKGTCYFARLSHDMISIDSDIYKLNLPYFSEGAHIHKRNGTYYLCYGFGEPEKVAYAISRNINGLWQFKGILNEVAGNCETNRPAIVTFKEADYFFYHNGALPGGGSHRRAVCVDRLFYNDDGTIRRIIMTSEGVSAV
ncbi:family 43 glycosylhydrolase [Mucilaginibacter sp. JRF]|uniref:glycoside hydrolase family 43 protein n=1 Tax=Mucilaginibacter sp. JRF TaxID=2780088 RepID=UPI001882BA5A|nr:glycoside hydrolase family 43 protein [Mucilaginibacter sp. JRF]MBE9584773.1 family 43 glycosylhydrolase [Mucilaginibacter sp. JRF]